MVKPSLILTALCCLFLSACNTDSDSSAAPTNTVVSLDVYKSESCGCCGIWVDYMKDKGYAVEVHHPEDLNAVKVQYGIEPQWQSCHTAVTKDGKIFEGHIPARFVKQFLDNPPAMGLGLSVAGMPLGSPGMEVGDRFTPYDVVLLKEDGTTEVYATLNSAAEQF